MFAHFKMIQGFDFIGKKMIKFFPPQNRYN